MSRFRPVTSFGTAALALACGCQPSRTAAGEQPRDGVEDQGARFDPWHLGEHPFIDSIVATWDKSDRDAVVRTARSAVIVARLDGERLIPLPDCRVDGSYDRLAVGGEERRVTMRDENELADVFLLGGRRYVPVMHEIGELFVRARVAEEYTFRSKVYFSPFPRRRLSGSCDAASHVIEHVWIGAFELAAADVPPDRGPSQGSTLIREGGRLRHCERLRKEAPIPASCQELIAVDARPIAVVEPDKPRDPDEPFEYSPGSEPSCPIAGTLRFDDAGKPFCAPRQRAGAAPLPRNRTRFEIRGPLAHDRTTGLTWRRDSPPAPMSWQRARAYCHLLDRGGFMLPTPDQLGTLIEEDLFPAADAGVFPDLVLPDGSDVPLSFWVTDRPPLGPDTGSTVSFERGSFSTGASKLRARCVRLARRAAQGS